MAELPEVIASTGLFQSFYSDPAGHSFVTAQRRKRVDPGRATQVGQAWQELEIKMIPAYSPQACGRNRMQLSPTDPLGHISTTPRVGDHCDSPAKSLQFHFSHKVRRLLVSRKPCKLLKVLVRRGGLEPPRCYPLAPQASASANSAISAL
jgi:hypothetical protein